MLIYGILMIISGILIYRKATKIEQEMEAEDNEEIKKALAKAARKRKLTANIVLGAGAIFILASIVVLFVFL